MDRKYQGQPPGPREERYSYQILSDTILTAKNQAVGPIVSLYVNTENKKAIDFYVKFNFEFVSHVQFEDNESKYSLMAAKL